MLYPLNLHSAMYQLYLNKTENQVKNTIIQKKEIFKCKSIKTFIGFAC